ncbi:MAG: D-alanyl-D-alanine carboxypeptidase/D-alanyl-D-alanine-endopeptidase [Magnetococcales bacterium]|nr:D-alanyl-D-alanine carboxypeptidase/D-alanyl-D-alanine-endopeptidase [Magnetococcales bacterium]
MPRTVSWMFFNSEQATLSENPQANMGWGQFLCRLGLAISILSPGGLLAATKGKAAKEAPQKQAAPAKQAKKSEKTAAKQAVAAPAKVKKPDPAVEKIFSEQEIFARFNVGEEHVGFTVIDLDSGQRLAGHRDHELFIPASVAKVPTTVAALSTLGSDYRFETVLYVDNVANLQVALPETANLPVNNEGKNGKERDTVDHVFQISGATPEQIAAGNLYLKGGGDPFLTTADLMGLASKLKKLGITRWTGNYYYDTSLLSQPDRIDTVQEDDASYNPGLSALSVDFNRYIFAWNPSKSVKGQAEVVTTPNLPSVDVAYSLQQLGWNKQIFPSKPWEGIRIQAPAQPSGSVWLPVRNPGLHTALLFQKICSNKGIELPAPIKTIMPSTATPIMVHQSQPLVKLAGQTLEHSNNLMAELIGMTTTRYITGKALSLKNSGTAMLKWYQENLPEVDWRGAQLENHSGLSSKSQLTPSQLAGILRYADGNLNKDKSYVSLLPISGWTGTLAHRLGDPMMAMKVWAKTGTIHYSSGLAGYLYTQTKRRLVFAIFVTNYPERERLSELISQGLPFPEAKAKNWNRRAKAVEDAFVRRWQRLY